MRKLAESVADIVRALADLAELPKPVAALPATLAAAKRVSPVVFCIYFDLFEAVRRDDVEASLALLAEIAERLAQPVGPFIVDWSGIDARARQRYLAAINRDPTTQVRFEAPSPETFRAANAAADAAFAAFDRVAPEIAGEVRGLLTQIVLVTGGAGDGLLFDGASSFYCWGALFLNAEEHRTRIDMIDGLAHESAHSHLYGIALGDPFVENPVTERYPSPLRRDPRHLDGIFHATYVSARMHYAHARLLAAGEFVDEEARMAAEHLAASAKAFWDGWGTFDAHARPTALGGDVMAAAHAYMAAAAPHPN